MTYSDHSTSYRGERSSNARAELMWEIALERGNDKAGEPGRSSENVRRIRIISK
jgi:hypothetical protein